MSSFVDADNQELLWKLFHKIPNIDRIDYESKANIFKGAIETVYNQLSPNISFLNKPDLQEINKQAMTILINNIHARSLPEEASVAPVSTYSSHVSQFSNTQMHETPHEKTQRIFEEKQQQYQTMNAKPDHPKPAELFEEKLSDENDGVITNMDELLAQYERQRIQDVPNIEPVVDISNGNNDTNNKQAVFSKGFSYQSQDSLEDLLQKIKELTSRIEILELTSQESKERFERNEMKKLDVL